MASSSCNLNSAALLTFSFAVLLTLIPTSNAIWLNLPATGTKCVTEEILSNVVVLADYVVVLADYVVVATDQSHHPTISVTVTSPYGNSLHSKENVTLGQFTFTTQEAGTYIACFWVDGENPGGGEVSVSLEWKTGIAAKDWETVARKEKIEGVELELRKLTGVVEAVMGNLVYLKDRESEMREVSEATNSRVAWLSIMSLGICIAVSSWQTWYLKQFFHKKKLI